MELALGSSFPEAFLYLPHGKAHARSQQVIIVNDKGTPGPLIYVFPGAILQNKGEGTEVTDRNGGSVAAFLFFTWFHF